MENREIILNQTKIEYTLTIKNSKRCYLRIVSGKVIVSAGKYFSIQDIEKFIYANKEMILNKVNEYVSKVEYNDGGYVTIFDVKYPIKVIHRNRHKCEMIDGVIYVYHQNIQIAIERYCKTILLEYTHDKVNQYLEECFSMDKPEIIVKKVKSRWGACYYKKNMISFNLSLVHLDKELIDYVVMHELCHFLQHNHSPAFYQELLQRMPNYKVREKRLKGESI